jgi:hypothetical protein
VCVTGRVCLYQAGRPHVFFDTYVRALTVDCGAVGIVVFGSCGRVPEADGAVGCACEDVLRVEGGWVGRRVGNGVDGRRVWMG